MYDVIEKPFKNVNKIIFSCGALFKKNSYQDVGEKVNICSAPQLFLRAVDPHSFSCWSGSSCIFLMRIWIQLLSQGGFGSRFKNLPISFCCYFSNFSGSGSRREKACKSGSKSTALVIFNCKNKSLKNLNLNVEKICNALNSYLLEGFSCFLKYLVYLSVSNRFILHLVCGFFTAW